jgi:hypothetical protein
MVTSALAAPLAAAEQPIRQLPVSPEVIGLGAMGIFLALMAITWAFRSVGKRH